MKDLAHMPEEEEALCHVEKLVSSAFCTAWGKHRVDPDLVSELPKLVHHSGWQLRPRSSPRTDCEPACCSIQTVCLHWQECIMIGLIVAQPSRCEEVFGGLESWEPTSMLCSSSSSNDFLGTWQAWGWLNKSSANFSEVCKMYKFEANVCFQQL